MGLEKLVDGGAEVSGYQRDFPQLGDLCAISRDFRLNHFVHCRVTSEEQVALWSGVGGALECRC